jgi:hypothetical protein
MDEEALNNSMRKFLRTFGVTAQREIEKAIQDAVAKGDLTGNESLTAKAVLTLSGTPLNFEIEGEIALA